MNLGMFEAHLVDALRRELGEGIELRTGPVFCGPATGVRAQVFVHAASYCDAGGVTPEGAVVARIPLALGGDVRGFAEQRPGHIDIELHCVCATQAQAQQLAGLVAPAALESLETLAPPLLGDPSHGARRLRFADHRTFVHAQRSVRLVHDCVAAAMVTLVLRLDGFLHLQLARAGGLARISGYALPLLLQIVADPAGTDLQREHVLLRNMHDAAIDLNGWSLRDAAARRPNVYRFGAGCRLAAGASLKLWSGRGSDDAGNLHWGRRRAVWNNTGDVALLIDPDGVERARASWSPPLPEVGAPRRRRR